MAGRNIEPELAEAVTAGPHDSLLGVAGEEPVAVDG
jgi:hypothetical protein